MKAPVLGTLLTSITASLCCIVPAISFLGGSGSLMSSVAWLEPYRPLFIGGTFVLLGVAWYNTFRRSKVDACGCEEKPSFLQTKKFLSIVTVISLVFISFPSYSRFLIPAPQSSNDSIDQTRNQKITLSVSGMTCASCEHHIESQVIKLSGVSAVKASYADNATTIEYDPQKVDEDRIVAVINATGYKVKKRVSLIEAGAKGDCCTKGSCTSKVNTGLPKINVPSERNENLKILTRLDEIKDAFNKSSGNVKFVAILSSTCGWCLQGAQAVQQTVVEQMAKKDIDVIIVWTNMVTSDSQDNAFRAASMFNDPSIVQYFDAENKFGDVVAKRLNPNGEKAWDIYMFYDKEERWNNSFPRPFEYVHQLDESGHPWVDQTKFFCGNDLRKRLGDITSSL